MSTEQQSVSEIIKAMAEIGWQTKIKGKTLVRSSLMMPINTIFDKLRRQQQILDFETLRAATISDVLNYLERTENPKYRRSKEKWRETREKVEEFVNLFFYQILSGSYQNKLARLMRDEKDIKAAYLFYVRTQIKPKEEKEETES
jgi:CRISPR-associated protein Csc3